MRDRVPRQRKPAQGKINVPGDPAGCLQACPDTPGVPAHFKMAGYDGMYEL